MKRLVTDIVKQLFESFEESLVSKVRETTGKLQDQIDGLPIENENLRDRIWAKDKTIEILEEQVQDTNRWATEAMKLGNYNEQYSRKHNIRMMNHAER